MVDTIYRANDGTEHRTLEAAELAEAESSVTAAYAGPFTDHNSFIKAIKEDESFYLAVAKLIGAVTPEWNKRRIKGRSILGRTLTPEEARQFDVNVTDEDVGIESGDGD